MRLDGILDSATKTLSTWCNMRSWTIWRKDGLYGVVGEDTNGRIKVIEAEPTGKLIREMSAMFNLRGLQGPDFWDKLKELFELHKGDLYD